jgi:acetoin utilization deacetylase AcuC-like enzyme
MMAGIRSISDQLTAFQPELCFLSAGFDGRVGDVLNLVGSLLPQDYQNLTKYIFELFPDVPIVSVLEGGYGIDNFTECVEAHVGALVEKNVVKWMNKF